MESLDSYASLRQLQSPLAQPPTPLWAQQMELALSVLSLERPDPRRGSLTPSPVLTPELFQGHMGAEEGEGQLNPPAPFEFHVLQTV